MSVYIHPRNKKVTMGLCEVCENPVETEVYPMHNGTIMMCQTHRDEELRVIEQAEPKNFVAISQKIDQTVQLSQDVHNAETIAFNEICASIQQDDSIPEAEKQYVMTQAVEVRVEQFTSAIFDQQKALNYSQSAKRFWQTNGQQLVGKLQADKREHFKKFDMNYQPTAPKTVKPEKEHKPRQNKVTRVGCTMKDAELMEVKYGVSAKSIKSISIGQGLDAEQSAIYLLKLMGKYQPTT